MPSRAALLRKLDKTLTIVRRPGDVDAALKVEDRYGNRVDTPGTTADATLVNCRGAVESRPTTSGEPSEPGGRNAGEVSWTIDLDPLADVKRTDIIREYVDCEDFTSAILHEWQIRSVDLVTSFRGVASHWELETVELS